MGNSNSITNLNYKNLEETLVREEEIIENTKKLFHLNGTVLYEGTFKNNKPDGFGKLFTKDGELKYHGHFTNGTVNGSGTLYISCKLIYEGTFVNGELNGTGKLIENQHDKFKKTIKECEFTSGKLYINKN